MSRAVRCASPGHRAGGADRTGARSTSEFTPPFLVDHVVYDTPMVRALGNGSIGALVRLVSYAETFETDGWVPESKARELASAAELAALMTVDLGGEGPVLHDARSECGCMIDWRGQLVERGGFALCRLG